jgi:hypothetical protein
VSSDQGGTLQPIQEHSWDVTWNVPDPRGVHNTLFTLHPFSSVRELETYFSFPPDVAISGVVSSKKTYDSPDKFVGGSPYEKIFQDQDSVIVLYDIPPGARFPHINGFFSKDLADMREDPSGLDLRAWRRRAHRLPAFAAILLGAHRRRRQAAIQSVSEEWNGSTGGRPFGIRRYGRVPKSHPVVETGIPSGTHAVRSVPVATGQDACLHLRRDSASERQSVRLWPLAFVWRTDCGSRRRFRAVSPEVWQNAPDGRPSLFTAVEEQLGLKLEAGKSLIEVLVVDHAERASEN